MAKKTSLLKRGLRKANRIARRTGRRLTGRKMLTVVIPLYNAMPYFKKTIQSILDQTYDLRDVEVLIMDDGSTDGSVEYAEEVAAEHPGLFRVVRCGRTGGPSIPRNMGIDQAKGKYIFFCDADDYFGEDAFRRMVRHAEEWKSNVLVPKLVSTSKRPIAKEPFRYGSISCANIYDDPACDSLSPCKLFRTYFLRTQGVRFREGLNLREDDLFVEAALLTAARISIAADYAYYYVVTREEGANLHAAHAPNFERDFMVFTELSRLLSAHTDPLRMGESKYLAPRLLRFSWMGCAKAIGLCDDSATQKKWFNQLRQATNPYCAVPSTRLLPSSLRLLLKAMEANDVAYFSQLAAAVQVNEDFSFRRYDVSEADTSVRDGKHYWHPEFAGRSHEVEVDSEKIEQDWNCLVASVIVPIYNKSASLASCLASLDNQTLPRNAWEVILIDDGSKDSSLLLCQEYAAANPNARVIHQENGGVSQARNTGIVHAQGKYLFFLDADDRFSEGTLKNVVKAFEGFGDQVDVVTFPTEGAGAGNGSTPHQPLWPDQTGTFDPSDYPLTACPAMNYCVRRNANAPILFDSPLKVGQSCLFIARNMEEKASFGFCKQAEYVCASQAEASVNVDENPLFAYDDMMVFYETLLEIAENTPAAASFCFNAILCDMAWRIKQDALYPYALEGDVRERADKRLESIVGSIPTSEICNASYFDNYHKVYVLDRFGKFEGEKGALYSHGGVELSLTGGDTFSVPAPKVIITQCYMENSKVFFAGRIVCPAFLVSSPFSMTAAVAERSHEIRVFDSSYDFHDSKIRTAKAYDFRFGIPVAEVSAAGITFRGAVGGFSIGALKIERKLNRHNGLLLGDLLQATEGYVDFSTASVAVRRRNIRDWLRVKNRLLSDRTRSKARSDARSDLRRFRGRRVWLYSDSPSANTGGNGLVQFLYDREKADGVERYYVAPDAAAMRKAHPELGPHCVQLKSADHVAISMAAEFIFTSFLEHDTFRPMTQTAFDGVGDLVNPRQTVVYLQHGVLHADLSIYIPYDRRMIDYAVTSTTLEQEAMPLQFTYPPESLLPYGMPRLDLLKPGPKKRKILLAPSWRKYLTPIGDSIDRGGDWDVAQFKKSKVYQGFQELFDGLERSGLLQQSGYHLDIKLHPNFEPYMDAFSITSDNISLARGQIKEDEYEVVISDFSSYIYDFLYVGAQLIYFVPDMAEFKAGLNHYRNLLISFEEGYGPLCLSALEVLNRLRDMIDSDQKAGDQCSVYHERAESLFLHKDGKDSERLYDAALMGAIGARRLREELSS